MVLKYGIIVELSTLIDWKRYILKLAQIVTGLTSYASLDSIYCETGWEKLIVRREVRKPNLFYKIINNETTVVRREVRKPNLFL
jgi:hypothetical protein